MVRNDPNLFDHVSPVLVRPEEYEANHTNFVLIVLSLKAGWVPNLQLPY